MLYSVYRCGLVEYAKWVDWEGMGGGGGVAWRLRLYRVQCNHIVVGIILEMLYSYQTGINIMQTRQYIFTDIFK